MQMCCYGLLLSATLSLPVSLSLSLYTCIGSAQQLSWHGLNITTHAQMLYGWCSIFPNQMQKHIKVCMKSLSFIYLNDQFYHAAKCPVDFSDLQFVCQKTSALTKKTMEPLQTHKHIEWKHDVLQSLSKCSSELMQVLNMLSALALLCTVAGRFT